MVSNMVDGGMTRVEFRVDQQKQFMDAPRSAGYTLTESSAHAPGFIHGVTQVILAY
jgi:hypothetical protein